MSDICCGFCGCSEEDLDKDDVPMKIGIGIDSNICYDCITSFEEDITAEINDSEDFELVFDKTPFQIVEELNKHVIGQVKAKRTIALAAYQHYRRIKNQEDNIDKNNVLLVGPTGSGKTLLVKKLASLLNVPFYITRANSITEAGYVGDDVEGILEGLLEKCNGNVKKAEIGIVFIDEIDKIRKSPDSSSVKDVSGLGTQNSLLTILEDEELTVYKKNEFKDPVKINTKNIMFIASGAFSGINEIVNKRLNKSNSRMGLKHDSIKKEEDQDLNMDEICNEDLINYGLVPEFVGRFPVITSLKGLTVQDLVKVMKEPENSILKQYKKLFKSENVILNMPDDVLEEIAKESILRKTGARGVKNDFSKIFEDALFEAASFKGKYKCIITREKYLKDKKAELCKSTAPVKKSVSN
jgi:ATP-dependent Clp protease ATP-binding subunit ClpX